MFIFFGTVFASAYLVRIFEIPYFRLKYNPIFDDYFTSVWFTIITLTTIGYGDIYPGTQPGKILTLIVAFWGTLLVSLMVVTVSNVFEMNDD